MRENIQCLKNDVKLFLTISTNLKSFEKIKKTYLKINNKKINATIKNPKKIETNLNILQKIAEKMMELNGGEF